MLLLAGPSSAVDDRCPCHDVVDPLGELYQGVIRFLVGPSQGLDGLCRPTVEGAGGSVVCRSQLAVGEGLGVDVAELGAQQDRIVVVSSNLFDDLSRGV